MLDATQTDPKMTAEWRDHVQPGDVVSFRFPCAESGEEATPKSRPCLVLDIESFGDRRYAVLAYGTTSRRNANRGYEAHIRRRADYLAAGLDQPTRFIGARRLTVPLTHDGFVISAGTQSSYLGSISGDVADRMNAVRGRIHAMRDIRAERRRTRRRRPAERGLDFTVESRRPRRLAAGEKQ